MSEMVDTKKVLARLPKDTECWEWNGAKGGNGYGKYHVCKDKTVKVLQAHRVVYEMFLGKIPDGLVLDHLCRNPICVNPLHLEAVSHKENTMRGVGPASINAKKTHCSKGHELIVENTYFTKDGKRKCSTCSKKYTRNYYNRVLKK